jgi:DNA-binding transcriptional MocR family regulator
MHLVARPHPACAEGFDDRSVAEAAARVGVSVAPLSACCLAEPATQGLLLGYAAVSPKDIEVAVIRLRSALTG